MKKSFVILSLLMLTLDIIHTLSQGEQTLGIACGTRKKHRGGGVPCISDINIVVLQEYPYTPFYNDQPPPSLPLYNDQPPPPPPPPDGKDKRGNRDKDSGSKLGGYGNQDSGSESGQIGYTYTYTYSSTSYTSKSGVNAKAGKIGGGIVAGIVAIVGVICCCRRKGKSSGEEAAGQAHADVELGKASAPIMKK